MFYNIIFNELPLLIVILLHPPRLQAYKGLKVVSPCLKVWQLLHVFFQIKVNTFLLTWVVHIEIRLKLHRDTSHHVTVLEHVIVLPVAPTREQHVVQGFSVSHLTLNQQSTKKIKTAWSAHGTRMMKQLPLCPSCLLKKRRLKLWTFHAALGADADAVTVVWFYDLKWEQKCTQKLWLVFSMSGFIMTDFFYGTWRAVNQAGIISFWLVNA